MTFYCIYDYYWWLLDQRHKSFEPQNGRIFNALILQDLFQLISAKNIAFPDHVA